MLVTSRSFQEYRAFFALTDGDLRLTILDCSAGASGFVAEVNARGGSAVAVDPAYGLSTDEVLTAARDSAERGAATVAENEAHFVWDWYGTRQRRDEMRAEALAAFAADLVAHPGSYVAGALPHLPFGDDAFDLALCSHLLFTWSDAFDEAWHEAALDEVLRVAPEARIFPVVTQGRGDPVPFLPRLVDRLRAVGRAAELVRVPYEFQRGADRMLRVRRG